MFKPIAILLSNICTIFIKILLNVSDISSKIPFINYTIATPSLFLIIFYYIVLLIINYIFTLLNMEKYMLNNFNKKILKLFYIIKSNLEKIKKIKYIIIAFFIIIFFSMFKLIFSNLKIYFVDVGQGDCTFIITPHNKSILIDGGGSENSNEYDVGKNVLVPYILDRGITKIDYIIISHFDSDHVQGILTVMNKLKVENVIISKQPENSENFEKFKKIAKDKRIKVKILDNNKKFKIEKDIYFDFLWPDNSNLIKDNVLNNNSIVCKFNYKDFSMLFTGDIEEKAEKELIKKYKNNIKILKCTILKVGHHGSKTSSTQEFLEAVKPKIALIGVGENNKFGHPNDEVIERLENLSVTIYRTDTMGEISIMVTNTGKLKLKKFIN